MKVLSVLFFLLMMSSSYSQEKSYSDLLKTSGLRENINLIMEIKDQKITHCPQCAAQMTRFYYKIVVQDAILKIHTENTARGPIYSPRFESHIIEIKGAYTWDLPAPKIPLEGVYIGQLNEVCKPWAIMANGDCRSFEIKANLTGIVEEY